MPTQEQNFVDQQLRPLCEKMRALNVQIEAMMVTWFAGVDSAIPNNASGYDDGRPDDGLTPMSGSDIHNAVGNLSAVVGGTAAVNDSVISKPTVRVLNAN